MPLSLKDLQEEEKQLSKILRQTEKELELLRELIKGRQLRGESGLSQETSISQLSVEKAAKLIHCELPNKWIISAEMTEIIKKRDPNRSTKSLRVNVGSAQKNLHEKRGVLDRKDIGDTQVMYAYRWKAPKEGSEVI